MKKQIGLYESSEILRKTFLKLKAKDSFSLRQWSELVKINAATLNLILNSKRLLPKKHLKLVADSLDFDALAFARLSKAHTRDWLKKNDVKANASFNKEAFESDAVNEVTEDDAVLLKSWLHLALLEFLTCENFREDPEFLASKFGVSPRIIRLVLSDLEASEFISRENGVLQKQHLRMRVPTRRSREKIRSIHLETLTKAMECLKTEHDKESFERRLITGYTVAVNPAKVEDVKLKLQKALVEACTDLSEGASTEVFQLQLQLFPFTRR